jgi:hypothetical protein
VFIGHFALGFAAKRATPRLSLASLFAAAQLADVLWPVFVAVGIEEVRIEPGNTAFTPLDFVSYPFSHSLALLVVWGILLGAIAAWRAADARAFLIVLALVVSHWLLDVLTHRPDMPLYPGGPRVGLGLWNSVPATLAVELAMFAIGVWTYARSTRAVDRTGRWSFVALVTFLLLTYFANIAGPPPPSVTALWIVAIVGAFLILTWSWWVDRHRDFVV